MLQQEISFNKSFLSFINRSISMPENLDFHCASGSKHANVHGVLQKYFVETKVRVYYL